ncbi:hypothetical protein [Endozoicomonas lisbonensis]|uniref:Right handed beta helix domain-containing protein n=1 Tax=Endozoicomonas lisbonensis TaxID=3120522 RepID=A0ABV2SJE8_9GAMM
MSHLNRFKTYVLLVAFFWLPSAPLLAAPTVLPDGLQSGSRQPGNPECEDELDLPHEKLQSLCKHVEAHGDLHFDYSMRKAAAVVLQRFLKKHPTEQIDRCVVLTPEGGNVDEQISRYNNSASLYHKTYTAFLLFGKGVKTPVDITHPSACRDVKPVVAASEQPALLPVPSSWRDSFTIKNSIILHPGQRLFGVPIDISNSELAEGYYVSLRRKLAATIICGGRYNWYYKGYKPVRNSFITVKGRGVFVSGLTNAYGMNDKTTIYEQCFGGKERVGEIEASEVHTQLIRVEIAPSSLYSFNQSAMIDISGNEFLQIRQPAISVALKKTDNNIAAIISGWIADKTLIRIDDNHIYSCLSGADKGFLEPALTADFTYRDYAQKPDRIHTVDLRNNLFIADNNKAISLKLSARANATLDNNNLMTADGGLHGISLTGGKDEGQPSQSFRLERNVISGFRNSLLLNGSMNLELHSNDLLGTQSAIQRGLWQLYPLALSGNNNNRYRQGIRFPCGNVGDRFVSGSIAFSDGTLCPESRSETTSTPTQQSTHE